MERKLETFTTTTPILLIIITPPSLSPAGLQPQLYYTICNNSIITASRDTTPQSPSPSPSLHHRHYHTTPPMRLSPLTTNITYTTSILPSLLQPSLLCLYKILIIFMRVKPYKLFLELQPNPSFKKKKIFCQQKQSNKFVFFNIFLGK